MITPERIKKRFELYCRWFKTFLTTEFLNLPIKEQSDFLIMMKEFLDSCKKLHEEAKNIKERTVQIMVKEVQMSEENYIIGEIKETQKKVKINFPVSDVLPKVGDNIICTLFSIDGEMWYSLKNELIKGI